VGTTSQASETGSSIMSKQQRSVAAATAGFTFYRITPVGKALAGHEHPQLRSRYLTDLLALLENCGAGVPECELRQFMPPASLVASIAALLELGLIERHHP
jgi:hypothetical protein